jgi:hypothetical protein
LNTMSLLPSFASSIRSLQAMYRISFMFVRFLLFYEFLWVLLMMFLGLIVCDMRIRIRNIDEAMEFSTYFARLEVYVGC